MRLLSHKPINQREAQHIRGLIALLGDINDLGYATSIWELTGATKFNQIHRQSPAYRELVRLGPRAMPFLLDSLDDATPTAIPSLAPDYLWGNFGPLLRGNPVNRRERAALKDLHGNYSRRASEVIDAEQWYRIKVGDVCFAILGEIVGRDYWDVRDQPPAGRQYNSTTRNPELVWTIRKVWSGGDPYRRLFDSLLLDFRTRGVHEGDGGWDEWYVGSELQVEAAIRLLYYFPKEAAALVAKRRSGLKTFNVGDSSGSGRSDPDSARWERRELLNGVRTDEMIQVCAWSKEPAIRSAIASIYRSTADPDILTILHMTLRGLRNSNLGR